METRGRVSEIEREVAQLVHIADVRPTPPASLSVEEAEEWKRVVNHMHAGWYRQEYYGVLVAYCRQVVLGRYFHGKASEITEKERDTDEGLAKYLKITKAAERADRAADKFGTTLRVTPQSRYDKDKAARDSNKAAQARPW